MNNMKRSIIEDALYSYSILTFFQKRWIYIEILLLFGFWLLISYVALYLSTEAVISATSPNRLWFILFFLVYVVSSFFILFNLRKYKRKLKKVKERNFLNMFSFPTWTKHIYFLLLFLIKAKTSGMILNQRNIGYEYVLLYEFRREMYFLSFLSLVLYSLFFFIMNYYYLIFFFLLLYLLILFPFYTFLHSLIAYLIYPKVKIEDIPLTNSSKKKPKNLLKFWNLIIQKMSSLKSKFKKKSISGKPKYEGSKNKTLKNIIFPILESKYSTEIGRGYIYIPFVIKESYSGPLLNLVLYKLRKILVYYISEEYRAHNVHIFFTFTILFLFVSIFIIFIPLMTKFLHDFWKIENKYYLFTILTGIITIWFTMLVKFITSLFPSIFLERIKDIGEDNLVSNLLVLYNHNGTVNELESFYSKESLKELISYLTHISKKEKESYTFIFNILIVIMLTILFTVTMGVIGWVE